MSSGIAAPPLSPGFAGTLKVLRRYAQRGPKLERCDFCSAPLAANHRHLLEVEPRAIICACDSCAMRFMGVVGGRYCLIPRDVLEIRDLHLRDGQWESFSFPINLVFMFRRARDGVVSAFYPSPAGATESLLPMEGWRQLVADNPFLSGIEADVQALLVNRVGSARQYFIAPMDRCFELAGIIRKHWRGLSGGDDVWEQIDTFFARLHGEASPVPSATTTHAGPVHA